MTAALRADASNGYIAVNGIDRLTVGSDGILTATAKPAQFDKSLKLATTSFVDESIGNLRGYSVYNASKILTAADAGNLVSFNVANSTLTLPLGSSVVPGTTFNIIFSRAAGMKLAVSGTDLVSSGGKQLTMPLGVSGLQTQATWRGDMWELHSGSIQSEFEAELSQNLGVSGWRRLSGGLILQWMKSSSVTAESTFNVNWPVSFPSEVLNVSVTTIGSGINTEDTMIQYLSSSLSAVSLYKGNFSANSSTVSAMIFGIGK